MQLLFSNTNKWKSLDTFTTDLKKSCNLGDYKIEKANYAGASPAGGHFPPIYFLPPHGIFLEGKSCCLWPKKTFKFVISAKTFFFIFGDHLLLAGKNV